MIINDENAKIQLYKLKVDLGVRSAEKAIVTLIKKWEKLVDSFNQWDFAMGGDDSDKPQVEDILKAIREIVTVKKKE